MCGGTKGPGKTTFAAELGSGVVVVRNVPASVCKQCGEEWIAADTARRLESIADEARQKGRQVEVIAM
jgi:YgiT-type zinc finger domain-containing protein